MTPRELALAGILLLAGFAVGSFVNVVIDRLPLALTEPNEFGDLWETRPWRSVLGHSRCSDCGATIRSVDLLPVVSWLLLRGRCRQCRATIGLVHPIVETAVPLLGLLAVLRLGWDWRVLPVLWLIPTGLAVAVIDLRTFIVPTRIAWPAFGVSVALSLVAAIAGQEPRRLLAALIGVAALAGPLFALWFIHPKGLGFGDVRLATLLGWTAGFVAGGRSLLFPALVAVLCLTAAAVLGLVLGMLAFGARGMKAKVPLGPSLVAGTLAVVFFVDELRRAFLG